MATLSHDPGMSGWELETVGWVVCQRNGPCHIINFYLMSLEGTARQDVLGFTEQSCVICSVLAEDFCFSHLFGDIKLFLCQILGVKIHLR